MLTCDGASSVYLVHLFMDCAPTSTSVLATKRVREDLCVIRAREAAWPIALSKRGVHVHRGDRKSTTFDLSSIHLLRCVVGLASAGIDAKSAGPPIPHFHMFY